MMNKSCSCKQYTPGNSDFPFSSWPNTARMRIAHGREFADTSPSYQLTEEESTLNSVDLAALIIIQSCDPQTLNAAQTQMRLRKRHGLRHLADTIQHIEMGRGGYTESPVDFAQYNGTQATPKMATIEYVQEYTSETLHDYSRDDSPTWVFGANEKVTEYIQVETIYDYNDATTLTPEAINELADTYGSKIDLHTRHVGSLHKPHSRAELAQIKFMETAFTHVEALRAKTPKKRFRTFGKSKYGRIHTLDRGTNNTPRQRGPRSLILNKLAPRDSRYHERAIAQAAAE